MLKGLAARLTLYFCLILSGCASTKDYATDPYAGSESPQYASSRVDSQQSDSTSGQRNNTRAIVLGIVVVALLAWGFAEYGVDDGPP